MSDLIKREDAINAVTEALYDPYDTFCAFKALNDLPSAEPRWIPVTERLPEIKDHHASDACLVCLKFGGVTFAELQENIFGQIGWDIEREDEYHWPRKVIAWMPLPEPYQEENHE